MRKTEGWSGLRFAVIALGLVAWSATGAQAAALFSYSTAGTVQNEGISGAGNVISYVPVVSKTIDPGSNIPLGSFQVAALQEGQSTTYNNTPFTITLLPGTYDGQSLSSLAPLVISGTLSGTVTGGYQSNVTASFDSIEPGSLLLGSTTSTLSISPQSNQKLLVPADSTTVEGKLTASGGGNPTVPVPEPSTIALFLTTIGGLGLRRHAQARRRASRA